MQVLFRSPVNAESLASGSAGACEAIFTNQLEIIKNRLQMKDAAMRDAVCESETFTKRSILWIVRNVAGEKSHSQQLFHTAGRNGRQRVLYDVPNSRNAIDFPGCRSNETIIPGYGQLSGHHHCPMLLTREWPPAEEPTPRMMFDDNLVPPPPVSAALPTRYHWCIHSSASSLNLRDNANTPTTDTAKNNTCLSRLCSSGDQMA